MYGVLKKTKTKTKLRRYQDQCHRSDDEIMSNYFSPPKKNQPWIRAMILTT